MHVDNMRIITSNTCTPAKCIYVTKKFNDRWINNTLKLAVCYMSTIMIEDAIIKTWWTHLVITKPIKHIHEASFENSQVKQNTAAKK